MLLTMTSLDPAQNIQLSKIQAHVTRSGLQDDGLPQQIGLVERVIHSKRGGWVVCWD